MRSTVLLLTGFAIGATLVCAGAGCFAAPRPQRVCETGATCPEESFTPHTGENAEAEAAAPAPIPVADWREPTPVSEPGSDQSSSDSEDPDSSDTPVDSEMSLLDRPHFSWGNSITILDLLDLLPEATLGDILDPATDNPGSFTTLELLCLDEGFSDSFCRSRYGSR